MGFLKPKVHPRLSVTGQEIEVSFLFQRPFMVRSSPPHCNGSFMMVALAKYVSESSKSQTHQ